MLFAVALLTFGSARARSEGEAQEQPRWYEGRFSGENRLGFRYRSWGGDEDADFFDWWTLRADAMLDDRLDLYFSGRLHKDVDGTGTRRADDLFVGIEERDRNWNDQLYQLYADLHDADKQFGLRVGRQYLDYVGGLHLDGANLRLFQGEAVSGYLFYGRPVSFYAPTSEDRAGGGALVLRPWEGNRTRLSYVRYMQDNVDQDDDQYSVDVWQRINDRWRARGQVSVLDRRFQTAGVDVFYVDYDEGWDALASVRRWGGFPAGESREYSPLFRTLGTLEPYTYASARVSKRVLPWLTLSPGVSGRFADSGQADGTNRDWGRYDLTATIEPSEHWTLRLTGEYWDVDPDDRFWGLTGEAEYREGRTWSVALGTAYADYEYDLREYDGYALAAGDVNRDVDGTVTRDSPDVYTVYARGRINVSRYCSLRARGEVEFPDGTQEEDTAYGLRTDLVLRF